MIYLIVSGIVAVAAGVMILIADLIFFRFCSVMDKLMIDLDAWLKPFRQFTGAVLLLTGAVLSWQAFNYTEYWQLHAIWPVALIFGVLFIWLPDLLDKLSERANRVVFPTKERLQGFCKLVGSLLILSGAYILVTAYFIR